MLALKLGLYVAGAAWCWVSWSSWSAGYPAEVALLRGMVAFGGISFVAYLAELVLATAPPPRRARINLESERPDLGAADDQEGDGVPDELPQAA